MRSTVGDFLLILCIAVAVLVAARLLRRLLIHVEVSPPLRTFCYRILVFVCAVAFLYAFFTLLYIPILGALGVYVIYDAARNLTGARHSRRHPLLSRSLSTDVAAAIRILRHPDIRCVVFGHTHQPMQIDLGIGKRYVNSGTWVRVVDVRDVRGEPTAPNPYVAITGQGAQLMSWRGTQPGRLFVNDGDRPQPAASAIE